MKMRLFLVKVIYGILNSYLFNLIAILTHQVKDMT